MTRHSDAPVRRRRVLFIPGFDPAPARSHRERYRAEAARQSAVSGHRIALEADGPGAWRVTAEIEGAEVETRFEVLVWSDIVRGEMRKGGVAGDFAALLRTAWVYVSSGALLRLARLRKGPVIAALYPVAVLGAEAVFALALVALCAFAAFRLGAALPPVAAVVLGLAGTGLGAITAAIALRHLRRRDPLLAHYLMQDYAFTASRAGTYPPEQEARVAEFTARLRAALSEEVDEVLLVGHSSGAYLAVSALADLLRGGFGQSTPRIGLLTLGQVIPMVSFLPQAARLRSDLAHLAAEPRIAWVDVTAPGDGCSFALADPVAVTGVAPRGQRWPLVISAAFRHTLSPAVFARLRWRFRAAHFQYLCAFDRPGDYDYFAITAGPRTLAERFAGRAPSPSRITRPLSGHRSLRP